MRSYLVSFEDLILPWTFICIPTVYMRATKALTHLRMRPYFIFASSEGPDEPSYASLLNTGMRAAKALTSQRIWAGSSEPSILAYAIGTKISQTGPIP